MSIPQEKWARRKSGSGANSECQSPHTAITTTTTFLVKPSTDKSADSVHLLLRRLAGPAAGDAYHCVLPQARGHKAKGPERRDDT